MSERTRAVNLRFEEADVRVCRPSKWGNPFSHKRGTLATEVVATRGEAIERYRAWIASRPELLAALGELRGKRLGCWCKPAACHADVLAELADAPLTEECR